MTDELWDWADVKALDYVTRYYFGRSDLRALRKTLAMCACVDWQSLEEEHRASIASAIRYGAEMAERDLLRNARYYSADATGIEEQEFLEEAASVAAENLDAARETAQRRNEWPDWVEPIEYGYLVPIAKATMVPVGDDGACDYRLEPVR